MSEIILFHHAQGLTPGVQDFADRLRSAGHTVHVPDLYDGRTFDDVESGVAHVQQLGFDTVRARGVAAAEELPNELVYAGFSLGVMPAQQLAQTRPGAVGALFFDGCLPAAEFGDWPAGLPAQVHAGTDDPWFGEDMDAARALAESQPSVELFLYSGTDHLFADSSLPAYAPEAADLLRERTLGFLTGLDERDR
ncbi:dienelactone hydrolase [Enemella evansiae]|uniref:dienelactone hydrolase family protein n=1 Tax=Enemella evansiae TaxID=2016499 RepID=UPI000B977165|nr:dienelactone hydrolase family protein [Enemella evansiae]OYO19024.1 dienelactone hydrolase [Enemella evansiae]